MRRLKELTPKEQLDRQTSYLTFLPRMYDGFHTGYHTNPGIVTDRNKRPGDWLESMARNMHTNGRNVGYSIPDVLACEQQLRRLARLDTDEAHKSRQMTDYRAVLATLLLWDSWEKDRAWSSLEIICLSEGQTAFASSVTAALTPKRAPDGLWVVALRSARNTESALVPLALLSNAMVIIPAANPGDLSDLLPPCVRWYDRDQHCFTDPCLSISQRDAFVLVSRLRVLQQLKEQPVWKSPLLQADDQLVSLLERFADDLFHIHSDWKKQLMRRSASSDLRLLTLAACSQDSVLPIQKHVLRPAELPLLHNPLLSAFAPEGLPACVPDELTLYTLDSTPFACASHDTLFKPADQPEDTVLKRLQTELDLLQKHDPHWRQQTAQALRSLQTHCQHTTGLIASIPQWLELWANELEAVPAPAVCELTVELPLKECPAALRFLLGHTIGMTDADLIENVFSDALLCFEDTFIPPLSPVFCRWLMAAAETPNPPELDPDSFAYTAQDGWVTASFCVMRKAALETAASAVTFRRRYRTASHFESGSAVTLPASERPGVTVWPNVRFAPGLWKSYAVFTEHPGAVSAWAYGSDGWQQGERYHSASGSWQTVCVDQFPAFVALKRGDLSLGALVNHQPRRLLKHEPAAAIAIDFGSISTTVMLRQGDDIQPASLPECLHGTLLEPGCSGDLLTNAFLPEDVLLPGSSTEATFYSVMDMFTDEPERWHTVLKDGHIYYRSTLEALAQKNASALYYDLKWGEETYARRVMRLFLKQVMVQAALSARLWGSGSVSWRISMPNALPLHKQESYLELMRGLAHEVAQETGLSLTQGIPPVLFATENQADGLYFLGRSEINAQSGYLNLDIGGSTADLSLWLGGAKHASMEVSVLMGCRQMLFLSLLERHPADFNHDFDGMNDSLEAAIHQVTAAFRAEGSTTRGQRKCMLLLDDLFASRAEAFRRCMAQSRAKGRVSYLESLLLFQIGFLFYLCGEMLERAWHDGFLRMQLPPRMELCIAGNGGQLVKAFSEEQQTRLCSLALARLSADHPLQVLLPVQSRHPKQEAARGLLYSDTSLKTSIQDAKCSNGTNPAEKRTENLLLHYLPLFCHVFPQAANRLMPQAFETLNGIAIAGTAHMELDTIYANETLRTSNDDLTAYVRCFTALKQLWNL